ncbi:serine protease HTRA2 mitochondrial [Biomphalaria glabrata]|uniref:Serine protease HTRA2, mitochondrial n=1 Tax=Biomphalaria glabrata TaxID=6526 RepID=A0A182YTK8_BIOGL|nr:serine protease HTRA2, mitochondrial-like [Biomphalaria glabrata]KAI8769751.1 serine protease HTRA2; mitochondrial-like [Biomphalaria glabrata]
MFAFRISRPLPLVCFQLKGSGLKVDYANKNCNYASLNLSAIKFKLLSYNVHQANNSLSRKYDQKNIAFNRKFVHNSSGTEKTNRTVFFRLTQFSKFAFAGLLGFGAAYLFDVLGVSGVPKSKVYADSNNKNNFIADVVQKAGPAVVFLEIKGRHPFTGRPVTLSNGSGFIVRSNGIILTNAHVVANKSTVSVKLQDGRVMEGQVTAVDPISDLATVKITANNLPIIPLGTSSTIRPGEWVIAMGSPLSLSNTVTCGIVSSVQRASRELGLRNKDMDYIQTDAVINFGNSGGPLVNLDGQAIGINTMKVTTGISFAIPSDYAIKFLVKAEELMKNGQRENGFLKRRYMGITMLTLTENVMRDLKNNIKMPNFPDVDGGVFVYKVIPGSPAHIGGILAGDIIIDISGTPIKSAADVYDAVEKSDYLKVTLIRGSEKKVIPIDTKQTI